jgi:hypothetical protein
MELQKKKIEHSVEIRKGIHGFVKQSKHINQQVSNYHTANQMHFQSLSLEHNFSVLLLIRKQQITSLYRHSFP